MISGDGWMKLAAGLWLLRFAGEDRKLQSISAAELLSALCMAVLMRCLHRQSPEYMEILWGITPGCIVLASAFTFRGQAGAGDGLCILLLGIFVDGDTAVLSACAGSLLLLITQIMRKIFGKEVSAQSTIPYLPFLTAGYGIVLLEEFIGKGNLV